MSWPGAAAFRPARAGHRRCLALLAGLAILVAAGPGQAADMPAAAGSAQAPSAMAGPAAAAAGTHVTLVVTDPPGQGFNDGRPADPQAGDNQAATLGEQRLRVLQQAAAIWAERIASPVPIRVEIELAQLPCEADRTVLGWAGPTYVVRDFAGAPRPNTHYPVALANALAGSDLVADEVDIVASFNLAIDLGCREGISGWWYGLDPEQPVPEDRIALLPVALHELAHGLGFVSLIDVDEGSYPEAASPTVWASYLYDLGLQRHWRHLSALDRAVSARNDPHLVWTGEQVNQRLEQVLAAAPVLVAPGARGAGAIDELGLAQFGAPWPDGLVARVVAVNDGVGDRADGCQVPFANGARLAGRIALIERGTCTFVEKVAHAQAHGAVAAVIVNNEEGVPPAMGGDAPAITIPAVMVTRRAGAALRLGLVRQALPLTYGRAPELAGIAAGCLRMYAPDEAEPGSSVSHFHASAQPPLLMAPRIARDHFDQPGLAVELLHDIGWPRPAGAAVPEPGNNDCLWRPLP